VEGARAAGRALTPVREALLAWALVIGGLAVLEVLGRWVPLLQAIVGAVAVAAFLWVPAKFLERRGQDAHDAGWRFDRLGRDLAWSLGACLVILPLFTIGFELFMKTTALLPAQVRWYLGPYARDRPLHLRLPLDWAFAGQVAGNAAVAFAEEFFYRGYMTMRFEERKGPVASALIVAALFALGHLLTPAPWRLSVFFPALLFGWMRAKRGGIGAAIIFHAACNLLGDLLARGWL